MKVTFQTHFYLVDKYKMIPLSHIGLSREDQKMLSERLFPEVNKIFLERLAKENGQDPKLIQPLDYSNHPLWKMEKMIKDRERQKEMLEYKIKNGLIDIDEYEYPYKTIEEAQETDEKVEHIQLKEPKPIEELNEEIEKIKLEHKEDDEKTES
jgi:hypothetical protein